LGNKSKEREEGRKETLELFTRGTGAETKALAKKKNSSSTENVNLVAKNEARRRNFCYFFSFLPQEKYTNTQHK
jgi:hypothetical protein